MRNLPSLDLPGGALNMSFIKLECNGQYQRALLLAMPVRALSVALASRDNCPCHYSSQ